MKYCVYVKRQDTKLEFVVKTLNNLTLAMKYANLIAKNDKYKVRVAQLA